MAKNATTSITFKAVDRVTAPLKRMNRAVDMFAKTALIGGVATLGAGLAVATHEYIKFEDSITAASAKFTEDYQKGTAGFEQLKKSARAIGAATEYSATEAAQGLDFMAKAGYDATKSMKLLPGVVDLATAAQTDFAQAADIASDSIGAFGLNSDNAEVLGKNFSRVMDVMAKTTTTSNTDLVELFETVKKGAPSFTSAGQSMESFNALAGVMAGAGVKGAESGTQLRNVMLSLAKATPEAEETLAGLGVQTQDANGNFRDVIDILADLENGLKGMGSAQKSAAITTIFGRRAQTGVNILLKEGSEKLRSYRAKLDNSAGASAKMAAVMRDSLGNQIKIMKSALTELGFKFVEAFQKQGSGGLKKFTDAVQKYDPTPIVNGLTSALRFFKRMWDGGFIQALVAGIAAYKASAKALAAYKIAMDLYKISLEKTITLQSIFNAISPIGWITIAVAGLTLFYNNIDWVQKKVEELRGWILKVFEPISWMFSGSQTPAFAGGGAWGDARGYNSSSSPIISANSGVIQRSESIKTNRSEVALKFQNAPAGMSYQQTGNAPDVTIDTGYRMR